MRASHLRSSMPIRRKTSKNKIDHEFKTNRTGEIYQRKWEINHRRAFFAISLRIFYHRETVATVFTISNSRGNPPEIAR